MATAKAFGSITISDITDVGRLSSYLQSNMPITSVYDPNTNTYTPDWSTNHLVITPVIYFNDTQIVAPKEGLTIVWKRQAGSGSETDLIAGESTNNGILTVSNNVLSSIQSGLITYIANIEYVDPDTRVALSTRSVMTFSLTKNSTIVKDISISGESVFLYNTESTLISSDSITLTAKKNNVTISKWQYKNASGTFVDMTKTNNASITGDTIVIKASETGLFVGDVCTVKVLTTTSSVFDIHTITKIRDGAAGSDTVSLVLTNESQTLPCDSHGDVTSYVGASTQIFIYEAGEDVTSSWTITDDSCVESTGVVGNYNSSTHTYTVTSLTPDAGYVDITCTKEGQRPLTKRFSVIKQKQGANGADAVVYTIDSSDNVIVKNNKTNVLTPSTVTFFAKKNEGNKDAVDFNGYFKIVTSTDGTTWTNGGNSTDLESSHSYTPDATVKFVRGYLFASAASATDTSNALDYQTIAVISDGKDGDPGAKGDGGTSVILGNEAQIINCKSDGTVKNSVDITIPFYGYKGIARAACTCSPSNLPTGVTVKQNTAATTSAGGTLVLTVAANSNLGGNASGEFVLSFTCNSTTVEKRFSWSKNIDVDNPITFQIFAPGGDIIVNGANNVTLQTLLLDGSEEKDAVSYQWMKFTSGSYVNITDATANTLTVTPSMVDTYAAFMCEARYPDTNHIHKAYYAVTDRSDPIDLQVYCSVGTQFTNDISCGAIYVETYLNGVEVDALKSTRFLTQAPTSAVNGDYYYHLDPTLKTATLKKYSGGRWQDAPTTELPKGTYNFYRRNYNGTLLDTSTAWKTGKVVCVTKDDINKSTTFFCQAENIPLT